jgi:hypothetical protein
LLVNNITLFGVSEFLIRNTFIGHTEILVIQLHITCCVLLRRSRGSFELRASIAFWSMLWSGHAVYMFRGTFVAPRISWELRASIVSLLGQKFWSMLWSGHAVIMFRGTFVAPTRISWELSSASLRRNSGQCSSDVMLSLNGKLNDNKH